MPEYEIEFTPFGCRRSSIYHIVFSRKEANQFIARMIRAEIDLRTKKPKEYPDSEMGQWFRILSEREPSSGYRYVIRKINRVEVASKEVIF